MNSRERVLTSLNHREPDRIPIDFSGHRSSGIAAVAYARLRKHLGLEERRVRVYDLIQQLAIVDEDVLARFGADTVELGRAFALEDTDWADWILPDGTPCSVPSWSVPERLQGRWVLRSKTGRIIAHMPDGTLYFEQTYYPFTEGDPDFRKIQAAFDENRRVARDLQSCRGGFRNRIDIIHSGIQPQRSAASDIECSVRSGIDGSGHVVRRVVRRACGNREVGDGREVALFRHLDRVS